MSDEVTRIKDRLRHELYFQTDAGKAARQRDVEHVAQGRQILREQGVPKKERTTSRCRRALREYLERLRREAEKQLPRASGEVTSPVAVEGGANEALRALLHRSW
jgi:hypothetical protein